MYRPHRTALRECLLVAAILFGLSGSQALAKDPPSNLCSLLTPAQL